MIFAIFVSNRSMQQQILINALAMKTLNWPSWGMAAVHELTS
jgi:hypothetical protein